MGLFTERDEETPNQIIIGKLNRIEAKLDEVIAAMHAYDDANIEEINKEYGESSFEAFMDETELNKRMDIIGQNGNEGSHYVTNEEADEDAKINKPAKRTGEKKKRDKWVSPYPPNPKRKSAVVEHEKHPPHKH
jgi:hypothetical protein